MTDMLLYCNHLGFYNTFYLAATYAFNLCHMTGRREESMEGTQQGNGGLSRSTTSTPNLGMLSKEEIFRNVHKVQQNMFDSS